MPATVNKPLALAKGFLTSYGISSIDVLKLKRRCTKEEKYYNYNRNTI
jgi:hypothetical protein